MSIELRPIDEENFRPVVRLEVAPDQSTFVATNVFSIAESKVCPYLEPWAVYSGDELVGFTLYGRDPETGKYWIVRLMIAADQQGKGYGRAVLDEIAERMRQLPDCDEIYLSCVPANTLAEGLYRRFGFEPTGEIDDGEIVMKYKIPATPAAAAQ
jgi:diamine N-acetyltransferase